MTAIKKVQNACNLNEEDARQEIASASENLLASDEITIADVEDFCYGLGIDEEDLFSNPEMLLMGF